MSAIYNDTDIPQCAPLHECVCVSTFITKYVGCTNVTENQTFVINTDLFLHCSNTVWLQQNRIFFACTFKCKMMQKILVSAFASL